MRETALQQESPAALLRSYSKAAGRLLLQRPSPAYYTLRKRFVRSTNDRKVAGVCAGVADYFDMDPTLVRILWALATLIPGPNVLAYIVIWIAADEGPNGDGQHLGHRCFLGFSLEELVFAAQALACPALDAHVRRGSEIPMLMI